MENVATRKTTNRVDLRVRVDVAKPAIYPMPPVRPLRYSGKNGRASAAALAVRGDGSPVWFTENSYRHFDHRAETAVRNSADLTKDPPSGGRPLRTGQLDRSDRSRTERFHVAFDREDVAAAHGMSLGAIDHARPRGRVTGGFMCSIGDRAISPSSRSHLKNC